MSTETVHVHIGIGHRYNSLRIDTWFVKPDVVAEWCFRLPEHPFPGTDWNWGGGFWMKPPPRELHRNFINRRSIGWLWKYDDVSGQYWMRASTTPEQTTPKTRLFVQPGADVSAIVCQKKQHIYIFLQEAGQPEIIIDHKPLHGWNVTRERPFELNQPAAIDLHLEIERSLKKLSDNEHHHESVHRPVQGHPGQRNVQRRA